MQYVFVCNFCTVYTGEEICADSDSQSWEVFTGGSWQADPSAQVSRAGKVTPCRLLIFFLLLHFMYYKILFLNER